MLELEKAIVELQAKSMEEIERETAMKWGSRAAASYTLVGREVTPGARFKRFYEAENFRQEAFEHASMVEDDGALLQSIRKEVEEHRSAALTRLGSHEMAATR
ncbi:MAG: hypothetical protein HY556_07035 [Euryarchaeota archaeon]|nr:hypothetical protein [Euryarchaeota archaeon]